MRKSKTFESIYNEIDAVLTDARRYQLQRALAYLQARYCVLHYCSGPRMPVDVWSSRKLPLDLRRTVRKHRLQIAGKMHQGATDVCPNPTLHKRYHRRGMCQMCQQLEPYLEPVSRELVLSS